MGHHSKLRCKAAALCLLDFIQIGLDQALCHAGSRGIDTR